MINKFAVLLKPVMTEKSYSYSGGSVVVFQVLKTANKNLIKEAFQSIFNKQVSNVRVLNRKPKIKKFRGHKGVRVQIKIAYIKLADGQNFDLSDSLSLEAKGGN